MAFLKVDRWGGEANFELATPTSVSNVNHRVYSLEPSLRDEHGGVEWEITLARKPAFNSVALQVNSKNLKFLNQPALTALYPERDCKIWTPTHVVLKKPDGPVVALERPIDVVDSVAVYHSSKQNNEYKAGKAFHIYRPKLVDANGETAWGAVRYNEQTNALVVTLPSDWLADAPYPVVVDPTFGKTDTGSTSNELLCDYVKGSIYTCAGAGSVDTYHIHGRSASGTIPLKMCLYEETGGTPDTFVGKSNEINVDTNAGVNKWWIPTPDGATAVSAQDYLIGWNQDTAGFHISNDNQANATPYDAVAYDTWNDPFDLDGTTGYLCCVYVTYTAAGALSIPVAMNQYGTHINKKIKGG